MRPTIIRRGKSQQRTTLFAPSSEKFVAKHGKVKRLSDGISLRIVGKSERDKLADALAAMSGDENETPAPSPSARIDQALDTDDAVAAPAPDASVFAPKQRTADLIAQRRLHSQRTAIPILLTCGILLPAIGALKWLAPRDSVFAQWDIWMPLALGQVGVLLLIVAVINMLHVRQALRQGQV